MFMVEIKNTSIEWKQSIEQASLDNLVLDLSLAEHEKEVETELEILQNSTEVNNVVESAKFLDDAGKVTSFWSKSLSETPVDSYRTFEFCIWRFLVLPIFIKWMVESKKSDWENIDIKAYTTLLESISLWSMQDIEIELNKNNIHLHEKEKQLLQNAKADTVFMKEWRQKRLSEVTGQIKRKMITYAKEYNTFKEKGIAESVPDSIRWYVSRYKEEGSLLKAREQSDSQSKSIVAAIAAAWLVTWGFFLWGKKRKKRWLWERVRDFVWDIAKWGVAWFTTKILMDKFMPKELTFDQSLDTIWWEIVNRVSENNVKRSFDTITYDEFTGKVGSYHWKETLINKENKTLPWLQIQFTSYKSLLHMANMVNYVKNEYEGTWDSDKPFYTDDLTWDIYISRKNWDKEVISWGRRSTLSLLCPEINKSHNSRTLVCNYLKNIDDTQRKEWDQEKYDPPKNQIEKTINTIVEWFENTKQELIHWVSRNLKYKQISENEYSIISRGGNTTTIEIKKHPTTWKEQGILIDWFEIPISLELLQNTTHIHKNSEEMFMEAIRIANLKNKLKKMFWGSWVYSKKHPYSYDKKMWLYVHLTKKHYNENVDSFRDTVRIDSKLRVLKNNTFKKFFPTLHKSLDFSNWKMDKDSTFIKFLNDTIK